MGKICATCRYDNCSRGSMPCAWCSVWVKDSTHSYFEPKVTRPASKLIKDDLIDPGIAATINDHDPSDFSATALAYEAADREKKIKALKLVLEMFDVQDVGKWSDDGKMDLMTDIFAKWAAVKQFEEDVLKKEESMHIVINHKLNHDALQTSDYFIKKFKQSPFVDAVRIERGGYAFMSCDGKFLLDIRCGEKEKLAGLCPHYFYADTDEARDFLWQGACKRGGKKLTTFGEAWDITWDYFTEHCQPDYGNMTTEQIISQMLDMREKQACMSSGFEPREWIWELSADIRARLIRYGSMDVTMRGGNVEKIFGIEVRPEHYKLNHIKLVRKVKREEDMTPTQIQIHNEEKVREVARKHSGKLYMQYNATRLGLECVIVHDKGYSVEFEISCSKAMSYDEMHALDHEIGRRFQAERNYRLLLESRPFVSPKSVTYSLPEIDQVIFNEPATIVYWKDGTKTIVQARGEAFDPEKGMAMAIAKKAMGNKREYYHPFLHWVKKWAKKKNPAYPEDFMPKPEKFCRDCSHYNLVEDHPPCNDCVDKSHWEKK